MSVESVSNFTSGIPNTLIQLESAQIDNAPVVSVVSKTPKEPKVQCNFVKKNKEQCKLNAKENCMYCWRHIDSTVGSENTTPTSVSVISVPTVNTSSKKGIAPVSVINTVSQIHTLDEFKFNAVILPKTESKNYNEDYKIISKNFGACISGPFDVQPIVGENIPDSKGALHFPEGYYSLEKVINEIKKYYNKNLSKKTLLELQKIDPENTLYSDFLQDLKQEVKHKYYETNGINIGIMGFNKLLDSVYTLIFV